MKWKKWLGAVVVVIVALAVCGYAYLQHPKFGALPDTAQFENSPNYRDGQFHNLQPDPEPTVHEDDRRGWVDMLLMPEDNITPPGPIPVEMTDLHALDRAEDMVIWLGHSSYFIQLGGQRILIDPVLSINASPVPRTNVAFDGASPFSAEDIPDIDYLLISHDHWDHIDYPTLMALKDRIGQVVVGLGVGAHFRSWGFPEERIHEADWNTTLRLDDELAINVLPARHYSGRLLTRNQSLWVSYALETEERKLYFSGDSGYGEHFKAIGQTFGEFDLVMLDSGQYDEQWRHIHMMPEDAAQAADDLNAKAMMPAHVGKFSIAFHSWDDPFKRIVAASEGKGWQLVTPLIGHPVGLVEPELASVFWWETLETNE